jgi:hypothetical protein
MMSVEVILAAPAALVALDVEHVEVTDDVAEYDRPVARHQPPVNAQRSLPHKTLRPEPSKCYCAFPDHHGNVGLMALRQRRQRRTLLSRDNMREDCDAKVSI